MSQYLPNLRTLDLSNSRKLKKIIDFGEFPNLEWLNLEGCINLVELDRSILLLRKLVYLNVKDCKNLVSIPDKRYSKHFNQQSLNMHGCSKVFNNPKHLKKFDISSKKKTHDISESASHSRSTSSIFERTMLLRDSSFSAPTTHTYLLHSLRSLYCLRNVDISFCHLSQVPDAIECLHWLERLNLRGSNFVTLPSLKKLSKLVSLNLEHCNLLESLPQLPSPTTIGRDHRENNDCWITGLVIFNCPKLSDRERCSNMTFSWMTQFIKANQHSCPAYFDRFQIVTPGSEIPSLIDNQSMGDSIPIDFSPTMHDNINDTIRFVCCAVFSVEPQDSTMMGWSPAWVRIMGIWNINLRIPVIINGSLITTKSSHIWTIHLPRESYHEFGIILFDIIGGEGLVMEVKSCGYRWVCKEDLQEFNLMMNHEVS